ncbi:hypothetical protein [Terracidiphilus sp.]|jgi:hypothetical protein|uniref:hypothetical protein n=1 Tax=Terracidiphilus sp. TaxID=1964191 RepID=UPI003C1F241D
MAHLLSGMKATRYRSAWIWLAVAVVAVATVARAEAGAANSAAFAHPVFEFLSGHSNSSAFTPRGVPRLLKNWSSRQAYSAARNSSDSLMQAMLPVLFIGLIAPLGFLAFRTDFSRCYLASPALPSSFQRPPPVSLA